MTAPLELKIKLSADGSGLRVAVRDATGQFRELGNAGQASGQQINQGYTGAQRGVASLGDQLKTLRNTVLAVAGIGGTIELGKKLVGDAAGVQNLETRLRSLTGSAQEYADADEYLIDLARRHHKDILTLSDSYARLRVLQNSGLVTDAQTKAILEGMSNAATELGADNNQLQQSFYGLSQALSSGVVRAEEFNQVVEPLPGLMQKLDDALGEGAGGMRRLVNEGKVTSEMFSDLLVKALHSYEGAAERTGGNITATFTDLKNEYTLLVKELEGPIASALLPLTQALAKNIKDELVPALKELKALDLKSSLPELSALGGAVAGGIVGGPLGAAVGAAIAYYFGSAPPEIVKNELKFTPGQTSEADLRAKLAKAQELQRYFTEQGTETLATKAQDAALRTLGEKAPDREKAREAAAMVETLKRAIIKELAATAGKTAEIATEETKKELSKLDLYKAAEQKYGLPSNLIQAIAAVESDGNQAAVSSAGAVGVMQVVPGKHPEFDAARLKSDMAYNIDAGAQYLAQLNKIFNGDLPKVIAAYNAGQSSVQNLGLEGVMSPDFSGGETLKYVPKVLAELDKLSKNEGLTFTEQFKSSQALAASQRDAAGIAKSSAIDMAEKRAQDEAAATIEGLKQLKEQGVVGIADYYRALTDAQQKAASASIAAVQSKIAEIDRLAQEAQVTAKPEDQPKIQADFAAKKADLQAELDGLQAQFKLIEPANLINLDKEQKDLNAVVDAAEMKIAELRGLTDADPVRIKARLEVENADFLERLRKAGGGAKAEQYLSVLTAGEQAQALAAQIQKLQQAQQAKANSIHIAAESGALTELEAQTQLREIYGATADELDVLAEKTAALGHAYATQAQEAKNAAGELRNAAPKSFKWITDTGEQAAVQTLTDNLAALSEGAVSVGDAFQNMAVSIAKALRDAAIKKAAEALINLLGDIALSALRAAGGSVTTNGSAGTGGTWVESAVVKGKADGGLTGAGLIKGPGTGTSDSIPALLPAGSFIIKAASVRKIGLPALQKLLQEGGGRPIRGPMIPARVSNGEFYVSPDIVKAHGVRWFEKLNYSAEFPPPSLQHAYAGGGLVGASASTRAHPAGNVISPTVNVTVNNQPTGTGQGMDAARTAELGKRIQAAVTAEIVRQQRPGGVLY